jgi:tRNA modification GTPase
MNDDTIIAIATPSGRGGVGIARLSGPCAYQIAQQLTQQKKLTPRLATLLNVYDTENTIMDKGIVIYYQAPHSFTGEDVVEFQLHGSPFVLDSLISESIKLGARIAEPGEFSYRAFQNDKIDLVQAEAIADLIQASSSQAAKLAVKSLQGDFSKEVNHISDALVYLRTYVEATIDFPDEDIDAGTFSFLKEKFDEIQTEVQSLLNKSKQGQIIKEGVTLVIAGRPNAGKSTLINALAREDIAIVTDIPGTTRDIMKTHIMMDDIPIHIIDTAGLRESSDVIEQEGIKRAWKAIESADLILLLSDLAKPNKEDLFKQIQNTYPNIPLIKVGNKVDLVDKQSPLDIDITISAKSDIGLTTLKAQIKKIIGYQPLEGQFLARRRHIEALKQALAYLDSANNTLIQHALELFAYDISKAHQAICDITGEFSADDLLGKIFSSFLHWKIGIVFFFTIV